MSKTHDELKAKILETIAKNHPEVKRGSSCCVLVYAENDEHPENVFSETSLTDAVETALKRKVSGVIVKIKTYLHKRQEIILWSSK